MLQVSKSRQTIKSKNIPSSQNLLKSYHLTCNVSHHHHNLSFNLSIRSLTKRSKCWYKDYINLWYVDFKPEIKIQKYAYETHWSTRDKPYNIHKKHGGITCQSRLTVFNPMLRLKSYHLNYKVSHHRHDLSSNLSIRLLTTRSKRCTQIIYTIYIWILNLRWKLQNIPMKHTGPTGKTLYYPWKTCGYHLSKQAHSRPVFWSSSHCHAFHFMLPLINVHKLSV